MRPVLKLQIAYRDSHLIQVRAIAHNGSFGCAVEVYCQPGDLSDLGDRLSGLEDGSATSVRFEIGQQEHLSWLSLQFYAVDESTAAVAVEAEAQGQVEFQPGQKMGCELEVIFARSGLAAFCGQLAELAADGQGEAVLQGVVENGP